LAGILYIIIYVSLSFGRLLVLFWLLYLFITISTNIYMSKAIHDRFAAHFRGTTFHPSRRHHFRFSWCCIDKTYNWFCLSLRLYSLLFPITQSINIIRTSSPSSLSSIHSIKSAS
jgi:hypothetical protein